MTPFTHTIRFTPAYESRRGRHCAEMHFLCERGGAVLVFSVDTGWHWNYPNPCPRGISVALHSPVPKLGADEMGKCAWLGGKRCYVYGASYTAGHRLFDILIKSGLPALRAEMEKIFEEYMTL